MAVLYAHIFLPGLATDPGWAPSARFMWFELGYPAVLMFFVLSGYVIGTITQEKATGSNVRRFALQRIARLVPLNTMAVLLCWMLAPHVAAQDVVANIFFLQNGLPYPGIGTFPLLPNNAALWSLNYEVVYYSAFIGLWLLATPLPFAFATMLTVVGAFAVGAPVAPVFAYYACGALYWLSGLSVARYAVNSEQPARTNWIAAGLAFFVTWRVGALRELLSNLELRGLLWGTPVSPHRLDQLPSCLWLLLAVTNRGTRLRELLRWICLLGPTIGLAARAYQGAWDETSTVASVALAGAWILAWRRQPLHWLARIAPIGAISYGIYVIGSPLQIGQRVVAPGFSGNWYTFAIRTTLLVVLTLTVAWWLERRCSPPIAAWIRDGRRRPPPPAAPAMSTPDSPSLRSD